MSTNLAAVNTITNLQHALESVPMSTDMREFTDHFFAPGVYLRTLFIPKGDALVGAIHKHEALNIVMSGTISVVNSHGEKIIATAPFIFKSKTGQKAGYAITDVWYASVHPNPDNVVDIKQLEDEHTAPNYKTLENLS
jgi:hypothetical protein